MNLKTLAWCFSVKNGGDNLYSPLTFSATVYFKYQYSRIHSRAVAINLDLLCHEMRVFITAAQQLENDCWLTCGVYGLRLNNYFTLVQLSETEKMEIRTTAL